tara:strand:+ start:105 stop:455 length:351 start_codon:yes stop_codon:yes gene_type:complete
MELDIAKYDRDIKNMMDLKSKILKARTDYIKQLDKDKDSKLKYHIDKLNKYKVDNKKLIDILKNLKRYIRANENNKHKEPNKHRKNNKYKKTSQNKLAQVNINDIDKLIKQLNNKY